MDANLESSQDGKIASPVSSDRYNFYFAATNNNCNGKFTATCTLADSTALEASREYKVIEPLRKLVCTETIEGGYYNPSRIVYGTNAWLKVGVNGQFDASDVQWRVVSGPGRIVSRNDNDWAVSVEPTAPSGEVVVEAAFGSDSLIQPRFVLPIVEKRRVSVSACITASVNGQSQISQQVIEKKLELANQVFSQSGIEFFLIEPVVVLTNSQYAIVTERNLGTNALGRTYYYGVHPDVTNLFSRVNSSAEIKTFWVDRIVQGTTLAFTMSSMKSCVFANNPMASSTVVPHELGHAMGLKDIYNKRKRRRSDLLPCGGLPLSGGVFFDGVHDWGGDVGRGFYESGDTLSLTIDRFLMNGFDCGGCDIPYSSVEGYSSTSRNVFDTSMVPIGSADIR